MVVALLAGFSISSCSRGDRIVVGAKNFTESDLLALPDGTEDAEYLDRLREILPEVAAFRPEIMMRAVHGSTVCAGRVTIIWQFETS